MLLVCLDPVSFFFFFFFFFFLLLRVRLDFQGCACDEAGKGPGCKSGSELGRLQPREQPSLILRVGRPQACGGTGGPTSLKPFHSNHPGHHSHCNTRGNAFQSR